MLLTLLYHQIGKGKYANPLPLFEQHFAWIARHYETVLPGEPSTSKLALCLTFDDATFDFYHFIFPLLKKYGLKAVLAVPTGFIPHKVSLSPDMRLNKISELSQSTPPVPSPAFCNWDELQELSDSSQVHIASHSVNHLPLTSNEIDPEYELSASKLTLHAQLKITAHTFVYPFGRFDAAIHSLAKKHYPYIMRIGNALNLNWYNTNQLIYRVNADALPHFKAPFFPPKYLKYTSNFLLNTLRKK